MTHPSDADETRQPQLAAPLPVWTPDPITLALLLAVAELGSVGRAAAACGISQPSASARIARLERDADATLLARGARGSSLTPTGEALVAWAKPVVAANRELTDGIAALRSERDGRLRIAASLTVAEYLLPAWLLGLRRQHPDVHASVRVVNSTGVAEAVRGGEADLGFVESPQPPSGLHAIVVGHDRLALVVARGYPLAARAGRALPARDLVDQPLLIREEGSGTRETFLAALGPLGHPVPPHSSELGSTATIVATARAGGGVAVVSARAVAAELAAGDLVELRMRGADLERPLHAVWSGHRPLPYATELIELARSSSPRASG